MARRCGAKFPMCLSCASPDVQGDWTLAGLPADGGLALSRADRRLAYIENLLRCRGLTVRRAGFGAGFLLGDPAAGHTVHAASVDALWAVVQALTGQVLDPLDPVFLARAEA